MTAENMAETLVREHKQAVDENWMHDQYSDDAAYCVARQHAKLTVKNIKGSAKEIAMVYDLSFHSTEYWDEVERLIDLVLRD